MILSGLASIAGGYKYRDIIYGIIYKEKYTFHKILVEEET